MIRWFVCFVASFCVALAVSFCTIAHSAPVEVAIGDSIAVGLDLPGSAVVGIGPKEVVRQIGMTPLNLLHGRVVILSTGLSNDNGAGWRYVPIMFDMLDAAGAKVVLLGVGFAIPKSVEINTWLQAQAKARNVPFVSGWTAVHPANYRELLHHVHAAECEVYKICGV